MDKFRRKCPVFGCESLSNNNVKFFRFPTDLKGKISQLWCLFTRIKNFRPITSEALCENHFSPELIKTNKKGRLYLQKNAVPTIYYKNGEKFVVQYDPNNQQYVGYQAEIMLQEIERCAYDEEKEMLKLRYDKIKEIKTLCKYCFSNTKDTKCVPTSKLVQYSVDPAEMIMFLGINEECSEAFNDIICGNCFERFIDFSNYRKRCQTSQKELLDYMQDLDRKIIEIQQLQRYQRNPAMNWLKVELEDDDQIDYSNDFYDADTDKDENEENFDTVDTFEDDGEMTEQFEEVQEEHLHEEYLTEEIIEEDINERDSQISLFEITIKNEPMDREIVYPPRSAKKRKQEFQTPARATRRNRNSDIPKTPEEVEARKMETTVAYGMDNYKNKPYGSMKKIHECFFCRQKFLGKKEYKEHNCENKRIKCEVEGCEMYFVNQGGYNIHIQRKHALAKVSRHLCPVCKTNYHMSAVQFDEHCKKCIAENEYKEHPIKCDKCKKIFNSLQSFTAHTMFHDEESLKKAADTTVETPTTKPKSRKNQVDHMCDLCGRVFKDSYGLRRHQSDVHFLDFTGEMFYCDLCPIAKPTKRLLYNHMKSTHIIRWHSCEICGKVFKNRELWRKHQLVHGDFKRNNLCDYCPHRPGFVTPTALRKHLAKHHGGAEPIRKFICDIPNCGAAYSRDDQLTRHRVSVHQIYHNNYNENILKHYVNN